MQKAKQKTLWFVKAATMIFVLVFAMAFALFTNVTTTAHADPGEETSYDSLAITLSDSYIANAPWDSDEYAKQLDFPSEDLVLDPVVPYDVNSSYNTGSTLYAADTEHNLPPRIVVFIRYNAGENATLEALYNKGADLNVTFNGNNTTFYGDDQNHVYVTGDVTVVLMRANNENNDCYMLQIVVKGEDQSSQSGEEEQGELDFTLVTDESQITEENVGECTFEQAKAWIIAHWDELTDGVNANIDFIYNTNGNMRVISLLYGYITTAEAFDESRTSDVGTTLNNAKGYYINFHEMVYLCSSSGEEPATHVHDYADAWTYDENTHWHACQNDDCDAPKGDEAAHTYGDDISETAYYTCSVCGYENETKKTEYDDVQNASSGTVTIGTGILHVGGADIVAAENYTVFGNGGGTAVLSEDENGNSILTLINFSYTGAGYSNGYEGGAIDYRGSKDLIIKLVGNNTITKAGDSSINMSHGIYFHSSDHSLIIDGAGSLTISFADNKSGSLKSNGIFCEPGVFVMNGGTVVSDGGTGSQESLGIFTNRGITFNGGSFTGNGHRSNGWHSYGIYTFGTTTVNGGTVYATAPLDNGSDPSRGIDNSTFIINAGTITTYGKEAFDSPEYYLQFGSRTIYTITAGEDEASATEVNSVSDNTKYVHIVAERLPHVHDYSSEWSKDDSKHWHDCTATEGLCDTPKSDEAAHTYGDDISETAYYTCSVCGYEDEEKKTEYLYANHVHDYSSEWSKDDSKHWHDCTETEGLCDTPKSDEAAHTYGDDISETAYYTCSVCGYENETKKTEYLYANHVHDYSSEWSKDENTHWHDCQNAYCDAPKSDEAAHVFGDDISDTAYYTCSVCGYENATKKEEYEDEHRPEHTHDDITFTAWKSKTSLPSQEGNYFLVVDVTLSGAWTKPAGTVNLCLNGHGIKTTSGRVITINGGTLNIYDCGDTTHYFDVDDNGFAQNVNDESGDMSFTGGYITGGRGGRGLAQTSYYWGEGGGILVWSGTLNMYGGTILGNSTVHGGGVEVVNATMNMYGGNIIYNSCSEGGAGINLRSQGYNVARQTATLNMHGGNVCYNKGTGIDTSYCYGDRYLNLYGGNISNNKGTGIWVNNIVIDGDPVIENNGGWAMPCVNLSIKGSPLIRNNKSGNIYVYNGYAITIADALDIAHSIGVTMQNTDGGVFTSGWTDVMGDADYRDYFYSDKLDYGIKLEDNELVLYEIWSVSDPETTSVSIEIVGADEIKAENLANIKLEVKVVAEVEAQAEEGNYNEIAKTHVKKTEEISFVYDVKLIRKTIDAESGEETTEEIQPSDIKEGTTIKVTMDIPENLQGKTFKILHIHSANDIEYVSANNYKVIKGGTQVEVEIDRLSEFAFVTAKAGSESGETGEESASHGFCVGWIVFIFAILELLALALFVVLWLGKPEVVIEKCKLTALISKIALLNLIGLGASGAIFIFALVALICHACAISIISFVLATLILAAFATFFFISDKGKKVLAKCKDFFVKVGKWCAALWKKIAAKCKEIFAKCKTFVCKIFAHKKDEKKVEKVDEKADEKETDGVGLKESLDKAATTTREESISKAYIAEYLSKKYPDTVELNCRGNLTKTGLPLADTHYVTANGQKVCFAYVYETAGAMMLILKTKDALGKELAKNPSVSKSAFPKAKDSWYSVIVDDSLTNAQVEKMLDSTIDLYKDGVGLKESLDKAATATREESISKAYIAEYLAKKYPDTVELNCRGNFTKTGLPLADTHYVTANGQKVCFAYVYETAGAMMLILKTKDALGKELAKNPSVSKSAFPKAKDSWYSVIVDDSLTNAQVEKMLDDTIALYTND